MKSDSGRGSQVVRQGSAKAPFRRFDSDPRLGFFSGGQKKTASICENRSLILDGVAMRRGRS